MNPSASVPALVRKCLLGILLIGIVGMIVELIFLRHTEGALELIPLALLVGALPVVGWDAVHRTPASRAVLLATMTAFVLSGLAGAVLHYRANVGYERDSNPGASTAEVYRKAIIGSTPTLAAGAMLELGLVGLLFAMLSTTTGAAKASKGTNA